MVLGENSLARGILVSQWGILVVDQDFRLS
jgi:hypothetical protein